MTSPIKRTSHLTLRVSDLGRSRRFYETVMEMRALYEEPGRVGMGVDEAQGPVLVLEQSQDASAPRPVVEPLPFVGMEHFAFELEPDDFETLRAFYRRLRDTGTEIHHTIDHLITHSIYFLDPDRNLIEAYVNCPRARYAGYEHPYGAFQSLDAALEGREPPPLGEPGPAHPDSSSRG